MRTIHAIRLKPGEDLRLGIEQHVKHLDIQAGWIVACVGSLTRYNLRFANQAAGHIQDGFFEIISLSGTLSAEGCHLHLAASDTNGNVTGGHLLHGCIVYTTAEIVLEQTSDLVFTRTTDGTTDSKELQIKKPQ